MVRNEADSRRLPPGRSNVSIVTILYETVVFLRISSVTLVYKATERPDLRPTRTASQILRSLTASAFTGYTFLHSYFARIQASIIHSEPAPRMSSSIMPNRKGIGVRTPAPHDPSQERMEVTDNDIRIYGWPSKGGCITLEHADAVDFDFLGLDRIHLSYNKFQDQQEEDVFCQRMLLLGGKWWSSFERRDLFYRVATDDEYAIADMKNDPQPVFNAQERLWIAVGWPSTGGLWVSEFETATLGTERGEELPRPDLAWIKLAKDMDERCELLQKEFRGKFYHSLDEYNGLGFLNTWRNAASFE